MNKKFTRYLQDIGITDLFQKRTAEVIDFYEECFCINVADIFVSEYVDNNGERQYENLWLFNDSFACEAKLFLTVDDFDAVRNTDKIVHWTIKKIDYDFKKASAKSRMTLNFKLVSTIGGEMKASQENCDALRDIFRKYILPNI